MTARSGAMAAPRAAASAPVEILGPAERLVLGVVSRVSPDLLAVLGAAPDHAALWSEALAVATRNRVAGMLARSAATPPLAELAERAELADGELVAQLRLHRGLPALRLEAALLQLRALGGPFQDAGVTPLLYKGPDYSLRYFAVGAEREFGDIDLLVRRDQVQRAAAALECAGYRRGEPERPLDYALRFHLHATFQHPRHALPIELHWALDSPYAASGGDVDGCWARASPAPKAAGDPYLSPDGADSLAMMARHLDKHLGLAAHLPGAAQRLAALVDGGGLAWVVDLLRWFDVDGGRIAASRIHESAAALGARGALVVALRLAVDVDASRLPDWARELGERLPGRTPLAARLVYPDLGRGQPRSKAGEARRQSLLRFDGRLGFRLLRVLELLLPAPRVPGVAAPGIAARSGAWFRRVVLAACNLLALLRLVLARKVKRGVTGPVLQESPESPRPRETR